MSCVFFTVQRRIQNPAKTLHLRCCGSEYASDVSSLVFLFFFFCLYFPASILLIFTVGNWLCKSLHILLMLDCKIYKKFQGCFLLLSYLMRTFYCKYSRNSSFYFTNLFFSNRKCLICGPGNFNSKSRKPLINSVISLE